LSEITAKQWIDRGFRWAIIWAYLFLQRRGWCEVPELCMFHRRSFLAALSTAAALPAWGETTGLQFGPARPFSFDWLRMYAQKIATQPYKPPPPRSPLLQRISYDAGQRILFRAEDGLWKETPRYRVFLMHRANYSGEPLDIFVVSRGTAREILYRSDYFDYSKAGVDPKPLGDLGFAGFRAFNDQLVFQGASYFRSSGQDGQFGASARGIAVNTALRTGEEFPRFSQFWLERNGPVTTIYALLEGPSLAGAYKYDAMLQNGLVMNVHCDLFFRADVSRLGVAPLTSMYWYGENQKDKAADWRPEIHDSDGLAIWNGRGEHIWRPLINPSQVQTNSFIDDNPKGFGFMQRDR
jgi:glucans biosynthesis protein